jgi:hypothetical protein
MRNINGATWWSAPEDVEIGMALEVIYEDYPAPHQN